jgi:hypothetical protein
MVSKAKSSKVQRKRLYLPILRQTKDQGNQHFTLLPACTARHNPDYSPFSTVYPLSNGTTTGPPPKIMTPATTIFTKKSNALGGDDCPSGRGYLARRTSSMGIEMRKAAPRLYAHRFEGTINAVRSRSSLLSSFGAGTRAGALGGGVSSWFPCR